MKRVIDKTVNLDLVGVNGNAFMIMGVFQRQAKKEGWSTSEIEMVLAEAKSGDYNQEVDFLDYFLYNLIDLLSGGNKLI